MTDTQLLQRAGRRLESWPRTMILSHDRADGDALGAIGAMQRVIEAAGRRATAFIYDDLPTRYASLSNRCDFVRWQTGAPETIDAQFDGVLILDTCSWSQLETVADFLRAGQLPLIVVDHHATRDNLSGNASDDLYVIDPTSASTCGILHAWCELMNWSLDIEACEALFAGIATDTGWFRFSNTDSATLRAAAALVANGVRPDVLYSQLYASHSAGRVRLLGEALATLEFHAGGAVAVMSLTNEMFKRAGASRADTEDLINEPMSAGPVLASVLLSETDSDEIRISLRSKSPEVCGRDVDVADLAARLGGGGHRRAAGARITGALADVRKKVTELVVSALR